MKRHALPWLIFFIVAQPLFAEVQQRFPKPDFQSGYQRPELQTPVPRALALEYLDVFVLAAALTASVVFAHRLRSRRALFMLMISSVVYFGFWRKGCVCPVGSLQNITLALFSPAYAIPLTVILFFALPLLTTLFFGRTFCASVCPLGAIQDAVIIKPISVPLPVRAVLSLLPYLYLGLAVLAAAVGAGFLICRYDPFVGFFRFSSSFRMLALGLSLLLLGTVVARPYCRFLCPYGVLLNWMSRLSKKHVRITPSRCINCRLCEASCPFDAIEKPTLQPTAAAASGRFILRFLLLTPLLILAGAFAFSQFEAPLARLHPRVALAADVLAEENGGETTPAVRAFRSSGETPDELFADAAMIRNRFRRGGMLLGGFLGLVLGLKLIGLAAPSIRREYEIDRGDCFSCGRCFSYCPIDKDGNTLFPIDSLSIDSNAGKSV